MGRTSLGSLLLRIAATVGLCAALLWVVSCTSQPPSDQQIRQQAQQDTVKAKIAAQKAAVDARIAAANAERDLRDVTAGVKQGLHTPTGNQPVDVNSASRAQLEKLPGVGAATARRIEADRPYDTTHDMVRKGAISESEFDRIAGDVVVH